MIFIWGSRYMGKCDLIPGVCYVKTRFGHLWYIPLIPLNSVIVISEMEGSIRGVPIPLNFKSILIAWTRAALLIASFAMTLRALTMSDGGASEFLPALLVAITSWTLFGLTWHKWIHRASLNRASVLAEKLQLNEDGFALLQKIYGEAIPRGFAVTQPGANVQPLPVLPAEST